MWISWLTQTCQSNSTPSHGVSARGPSNHWGFCRAKASMAATDCLLLSCSQEYITSQPQRKFPMQCYFTQVSCRNRDLTHSEWNTLEISSLTFSYFEYTHPNKPLKVPSCPPFQWWLSKKKYALSQLEVIGLMQELLGKIYGLCYPGG